MLPPNARAPLVPHLGKPSDEGYYPLFVNSEDPKGWPLRGIEIKHPGIDPSSLA